MIAYTTELRILYEVQVVFRTGPEVFPKRHDFDPDSSFSNSLITAKAFNLNIQWDTGMNTRPTIHDILFSTYLFLQREHKCYCT